jgi:hypothetical protein
MSELDDNRIAWISRHGHRGAVTDEEIRDMASQLLFFKEQAAKRKDKLSTIAYGPKSAHPLTIDEDGTRPGRSDGFVPRHQQ